ncbi:PsbP domain-containing protein 3, chloroplastic [Apostasia shenzhenica]|uniref:PsbP domain-containing protein 3, chloroplastic n=1 Tax=Apostasia shenzhenica TaxID=1088818 RepID=A0A2I0AXV3_9ASPA|nr:PsbP domain-containing protein 3, chloroplastic [Apostasia shenzhenica]
MASVLPSCSPSRLHPSSRLFFSSLPSSPAFINRDSHVSNRRSRKVCSLTNSSSAEEFASVSRPGSLRRDALLGLLLSAASLPLLAMESSAESELQGGFRSYEDMTNKFKILVPEGWLVGAGETNNIKPVTAFYPDEQASNSNVSIAITGIGPDFTTLGSFGNVDTFAENLVNGLDRSWQRPPGLAAKLINSKAANGLYYIEYTLQNPGGKRRHIISAIGMASNGWYNRLYTVTGQFMDDESDKYQSLVEKSVSSFKLIQS